MLNRKYDKLSEKQNLKKQMTFYLLSATKNLHIVTLQCSNN